MMQLAALQIWYEKMEAYKHEVLLLQSASSLIIMSISSINLMIRVQYATYLGFNNKEL
jgi:hypothetical protein